MKRSVTVGVDVTAKDITAEDSNGKAISLAELGIVDRSKNETRINDSTDNYSNRVLYRQVREVQDGYGKASDSM